MAERLRYVRTSADPGGDGTTDTDSSGDGSHAYDSLANAELGERADLVTAGDTLRIVCSVGSGTAADTSEPVFADGNWTTDASNNITIEPAPGEEAQMPWDDTIYRLEGSSVTAALAVEVAHTKVRRIQIDHVSTAAGSRTVVSCTNGGTDTPGIEFFGCHARASAAGAGERVGFQCTNRTGVAFINCVVSDLGSHVDSIGYFLDLRAGFEPPIYNCVAHGMATGFEGGTGFGGSQHFKNCVAFGNGTAGFAGSINTTDSNNNASGDATAPGANSLTSISDPFEDAAGGDFHLASGSALIGAGADLSADADFPFSTDFDGETRSAPWDIGADEVVSTGGATGSLFTHPAPTLDGPAVQVGDGTVVARNLFFPSDEYATPFWVRPDGVNARTQRVDSLPATLILYCGQIEVLSSAPV